MHQVKLKCRCGKIEGIAKNVKPKAGIRVVCYCNSCQNYARHLQDHGQGILDEYGGTDIYQLAPCQVEFSQGAELIKGIKLSEKGVHRWFASCCNTPIGNTVSLKTPFIGLIHNIIDDHANSDKHLGPVRARVHVYGAHGQLPAPQSKLLPVPVYIAKFILKILIWKITGKGKSSPFYDVDGKEIYPLTTL